MAYWISNKVNKIRENLPHRHPKLPDFHLADERIFHLILFSGACNKNYNPIGIGEKIAPDIAERESCTTANPYPDFPRVANIQKIDLWNTKCETWMCEEYVSCVFGVKIYPKINIKRIVHQPII
ncbi:15109_t:CDS:2, partial [Dentiscutata heterogama]